MRMLSLHRKHLIQTWMKKWKNYGLKLKPEQNATTTEDLEHPSLLNLKRRRRSIESRAGRPGEKTNQPAVNKGIRKTVLTLPRQIQHLQL